jgi:hypothetical protein
MQLNDSSTTDGHGEESVFTLLKRSHHSVNSLRSPKDNLSICLSVFIRFIGGLIESSGLGQ